MQESKYKLKLETKWRAVHVCIYLETPDKNMLFSDARAHP